MVAREATERKPGARGLRSIMESILFDTIFDLPSLEGVEQVVITTFWPSTNHCCSSP